MTSDELDFYLRHRNQICEWAAIEKRAKELMRDTVSAGSHEEAMKLLMGESGDAEVDFYVRNRSIIAQWDDVQIDAGQALHTELLAAAPTAGITASEEKMGWTTLRAPSPELDRLGVSDKVWVELMWTKQHLFTTRRGFPFPRLALTCPPAKWDERLSTLTQATAATAREMGMKKRASWSVHWGMLDAILESQDLPSYANQCILKLQQASARLSPLIVEAMSANPASQ